MKTKEKKKHIKKAENGERNTNMETKLQKGKKKKNHTDLQFGSLKIPLM